MCPQERKKRNRKKEKGQESSFFFPFKFFFSLTPTRKARSRSAHLISQRKRQAKNYPFLKSSHTTEVVQKRERERRVFASFSVQAYTPSRQAAKRRGKVVTKLLTPASSPPHTHNLSLFFFSYFSLSFSLPLFEKRGGERGGEKKEKKRKERKVGRKGGREGKKYWDGRSWSLRLSKKGGMGGKSLRLVKKLTLRNLLQLISDTERQEAQKTILRGGLRGLSFASSVRKCPRIVGGEAIFHNPSPPPFFSSFKKGKEKVREGGGSLDGLWRFGANLFLCDP